MKTTNASARPRATPSGRRRPPVVPVASTTGTIGSTHGDRNVARPATTAARTSVRLTRPMLGPRAFARRPPAEVVPRTLMSCERAPKTQSASRGLAEARAATLAGDEVSRRCRDDRLSSLTSCPAPSSALVVAGLRVAVAVDRRLPSEPHAVVATLPACADAVQVSPARVARAVMTPCRAGDVALEAERAARRERRARRPGTRGGRPGGARRPTGRRCGSGRPRTRPARRRSSLLDLELGRAVVAARAGDTDAVAALCRSALDGRRAECGGDAKAAVTVLAVGADHDDSLVRLTGSSLSSDRLARW